MKTKKMLISKMHSDLNFNIQINHTRLQVQEICYLGSIVTSNNKKISKEE